MLDEGSNDAQLDGPGTKDCNRRAMAKMKAMQLQYAPSVAMG